MVASPIGANQQTALRRSCGFSSESFHRMQGVRSMQPSTFDRMTQIFASRRTRRDALRAAGAGLGGFALAAPAAAQDATPVAGSDKTVFLFLQSFDNGSLTPKSDEDGVYELDLHGEHGRTIAFSDRPERIVASVPTSGFLEGLGFTPTNAPNAALVFEPSPGVTDVIVVELLNPRYDPEGKTLSYDVRILDEFVGDQAMGFREVARHPDPAGEEFGVSHLFIDDCADLNDCYFGENYIGPIPGGSVGTCWSWDNWLCKPDNPNCGGLSGEYYDNLCNQTYTECYDGCVATWE
jgi:hypothetical protein